MSGSIAYGGILGTEFKGKFSMGSWWVIRSDDDWELGELSVLGGGEEREA